jgi:hypothetical protein
MAVLFAFGHSPSDTSAETVEFDCNVKQKRDTERRDMRKRDVVLRDMVPRRTRSEHSLQNG